MLTANAILCAGESIVSAYYIQCFMTLNIQFLMTQGVCVRTNMGEGQNNL